MMKRVLFAAMLLLVGTTACASSGESSSKADLITLEEIDDPAILRMNAFEAIQQLRPNWLRPHRDPQNLQPMFAQAYQDGTKLAFDSGEVSGDAPEGGSGGVSENLRTVLTRISMRQVTKIEFINGGIARTRYGADHGGGVIMIYTSGGDGWEE